jgi:hypothetical protein
VAGSEVPHFPPPVKPPPIPERRDSSTSSFHPDSWTGQDLGSAPALPGYAIGKLLGHGGMGVVYQATQEALKRPVALKMIRADRPVDPSQLGRFRVEAETVARLRHPHVVQIYEVGESGGVPYFSLELLEGGTLAERLAGAPMSPQPAAELAVTLARTMAAVHRVGIVHRDLKPSNVLFDAAGTPKVTDFGLAKRLEVEEGQTLSGQVMGTPSYMAREQALGQTSQIGPPADIYALGAILYEMLTGRPPFRGPSSMETLGQVIFDEPVPPSRLQPRVPRDLETIGLKCLAKSPARRYATADDLADDLERFLAGRPIRARRTPVWERAAKWARRRPTAAALTAIGLIAAIGLAVASERHAARVARRRLEAMDSLDRSLRLRARGALEDARLTLATLLEKLHDEPGLAELHWRADSELRDVRRRLAAAAGVAADRERLARFRTLRDRALPSMATRPSSPRLSSRRERRRPWPATTPRAGRGRRRQSQRRRRRESAPRPAPRWRFSRSAPRRAPALARCPRRSRRNNGPRSRRTATCW